ncbi:FGGY family carbohydrate kinase [Amycolatopsis sp. NPDC058340]|uniref:FGGY family carbohydrate kinase n=1 Tax=Amycolatopsis sp. NPDC058340 TaxID=3346453 RepID=UPI00365D9377
MCVLAIDAGTSMIKTVLYAEDGTELAVARQGTKVHRPHSGWAEQDMMDVWNAVVYTVRQARSHAPGPVRMVTFTAQGDGCWLVDEAGNPTGPAVLWSDGRAKDVVERWRADGILDEAFQSNGSYTFPGLPNAILTWFAENDPDRLARSRTALYCGGWLFSRMTGEFATEESDASSPFLDPGSRTYSPHIQKLFGFEHLSRFLPPIRSDDRRVGELTREAAAELGLPAGTPAVMGPYDIAATAIGAGAVTPGQACTILGTTLCTEVVRDKVNTSGEPSGSTIAFGSGGNVLRAYPTLAGTEVLTWASGMLGLNSVRDLGDLAASADIGAGGITFLPYLSPAGERAPFLDPNARGTVWGLSLEHTRAQVARAVFEGLSMVIEDCLAAAGSTATELSVCGGGSNSEFWCQLIADVTGLPVARSTDAEIGAKGAFLTGLVATGAEQSLVTAAGRYVTERRRFSPDPETARYYTDHYHEFLSLCSIAQHGWNRQGASRG